MAAILCSKHGRHGAAAVCSHVAERVRANEPIRDALSRVRARYAGTTIGPTQLCPECAARFNVPVTGAMLEGDEGIDRFFEIGWVQLCPRCLEMCRAPAD